MNWHNLSGKQYLKAIGVGVLTSIVLSAIMVTALKSGQTKIVAFSAPGAGLISLPATVTVN